MRSKPPFFYVCFSVAFGVGKRLFLPLCAAITMPHIFFHGIGKEIGQKGKNPQNGHFISHRSEKSLLHLFGVRLNGLFQSWFC